MSYRTKIMGIVFVGLHVPLVALAVAAMVLEMQQAPVILAITLVSTLVAVAVTLRVLHMMLPPDAPRPIIAA